MSQEDKKVTAEEPKVNQGSILGQTLDWIRERKLPARAHDVGMLGELKYG